MPRTSHIDSANLDFRGDFSSATAAWRGHGKRVISVTCAKKFEDNRTILTDRSPVMYIEDNRTILTDRSPVMYIDSEGPVLLTTTG